MYSFITICWWNKMTLARAPKAVVESLFFSRLANECTVHCSHCSFVDPPIQGASGWISDTEPRALTLGLNDNVPTAWQRLFARPGGLDWDKDKQRLSEQVVIKRIMKWRSLIKGFGANELCFFSLLFQSVTPFPFSVLIISLPEIFFLLFYVNELFDSS